MGKKLVTVLSLAVYVVVLLNSYLNWQLFGMNPLMLSMLGIFFSSLALWLFVAIDWPSLLCLLGMALIPEVGFAAVLPASFGNVTFVFLLFTFVFMFALERTNFIKRVTAWALHSEWAQASPWKLVVAFYCVMLLISSVISPTILFMVAYPIFEELSHQFGFEKGNRNASILLVGLFTTIAIGTAMTPINHVFSISAIGLYQTAFEQTISYVDYMKMMIPTGLAIFALLLVSIKWIWKLDLSEVTLSRLKSLESLPAATKQERWIVGTFVLVVAMWLLPEVFTSVLPEIAGYFKTAGIVFPPLLGVIILALIKVEKTPLLDISKAMKEGVHWPSLLLVASTLALGSLVSREDVGLVTLMNDALSPLLANLSPFLIVLIFIVWAGLQTNLSSNLVTVSVVSAVAIAVAQSGSSFAANSAIIACFIGFMASIALMTPPAMPYVAISVGSNWVSGRDAFFYGLWMLVVSVVFCMVIGYPIGLAIF